MHKVSNGWCCALLTWMEPTSRFIEVNDADAQLQHLIPLSTLFEQKVTVGDGWFPTPGRRVVRPSRNSTEFQVDGNYTQIVSLMFATLRLLKVMLVATELGILDGLNDVFQQLRVVLLKICACNLHVVVGGKKDGRTKLLQE
jgi:hypothetical protein